jgi:hypothetical protein
MNLRLLLPWWRRRDRRVARLGGRPLTATQWWEEPQLTPFAPEPVDEDLAHREIDVYVGGLFPYAVDEATGHALDRLIDGWAGGWLRQVDIEYVAYIAEAEHRLGQAQAALAQQRVLSLHDRQRLADLNSVLRQVRQHVGGADLPPETDDPEPGHPMPGHRESEHTDDVRA